jgi:signal transduction histidine kinase
LQAWRKAISDDPRQTTARALSRGQLNDHIPQLLDAFERKLRSQPGGAAARSADVTTKREEIKHGLHRWQQGYRLSELMHEWGYIQICLFDELDNFARTHSEIEAETLMEASRQMITLVNEAVAESSVQFERMQQAEARARMGDLERALSSLHEIEQRRSDLIRDVVHDLNGNVLGVTMMAKLLGRTDVEEAARAEFSKLLYQGVESVTDMLEDLTELARLEAGRETREISEFDAAAVATELGETLGLFASERGLFLKLEGPDVLAVEGDPVRIRRLLQNLLLNALKYTGQGGVTLSWGVENDSWWLRVQDTGPGLVAGSGAPMVAGLKEATASARESGVKEAAQQGETSQVLTPAPEGSNPTRIASAEPGEGIGLSIVKRLCELLDASLEMASSAEAGTTFRVVLPQKYGAQQ